MLAGRMHRFTDDMGDIADDYEALHVVSAGPVADPPVFTEAYRKRVAQTEAMLALKKLGWSDEKIALAIDRTDRTVRRKKKLVRQLAEARGRV